MENYQEQCNSELRNQEIKSNMRTLTGFMWMMIAITLMWLLTLVRFFDVNAEVFSKAYIMSAILLIPIVYIYFRSDISKPWIKYFLIASICIISAIIASFLTFHVVLVYVFPLLLAVQYRERKVLWAALIMDITGVVISSLTGYYYGLCDLNLLFQSNHTLSWYLGIMNEGHIIIPFNENINFILLVYEALPRSFILFIFTIMLRYSVITSHEDAIRIADLTYHKDTDLRTKLFNKNKYEEMVKGYYPSLKRVAVIFWDINNLKKTNDSFGHAMGDALIETMALRLYEQSDSRKCTYRVGGDEFVMIIENPKPGEAEEVIQKVKTSLEQCRAAGGIYVSSAVGYEEGFGSDIELVIKAADKNMYDNKRSSREGRD